MIVKVEVRSAQGDLLTLLLEDISDGIIVEDIDGLGPVKANLVSSSSAGIDGEQYESSSREKRNIKFRLGLDPDPAVETVDSLRSRLYDFFMTNAEVNLKFFKENGLDVDIQGRVETCEPDIFTPEPTLDISIVCFDPDFYNPDIVTIETSTVTDDEETPVLYSGTVETGIVFTMTLNRNLSEFSIYHREPSGQLLQLDFDNVPLVTGDVLMISTVSGSKGATLTRSGVTSSVLFGVSPQSKWIELLKGNNTFRVVDSGLPIPYTIQYNTKYGAL